nr:hypothetical protein [Tanacetum cinerariifolium]
MMESPIAAATETNSTIKPDPKPKPDLSPVNTENNNGEITDSTTPNRSKKSVRWSVDLVEERTLPPLDKTNADADYNNNNRYVIRSIESDSSSQSFNINDSMVNIKDTFGRWRKKVGEATKKAEHLAGNTWQHLKTAPSLTDGALGRIAQGTKVLAEGGYEKIFRQTFETVPEELLQNSYACYLSTSAGPVLGVLYVSTAKLAFCSDNPLSYRNVDKTEWSYYKVIIPLPQLKAVNPSSSRANTSEKYIQDALQARTSPSINGLLVVSGLRPAVTFNWAVWCTMNPPVLPPIPPEGDEPGSDLHFNVDKPEGFWPKEDPRSRLASMFSPNIARPLHGVKLLGGPPSVDFDFSSELVMKRVTKTIVFMDTVARINDPQCELLLLCAGISKLYFAMRTCSPRVFEMAQHSFDAALRSALERIVNASGPGFGDWQWRLFTLPFAFEGLVSILQMALWQSQMEDHTSDWLRVVPISGLGQTMNACSKVFTGDIHEDHVVSCAGIISIKHRHNVVRDTLVGICFRSGISAGKEVDIGLGGGCDKPLRHADMLLYSWNKGLDVCVDLTGSSPLTQTGMVDFVPGRAVIDAAHRKRAKYEAKCANIGYGFLPFSFSSLGELEKDAVTLLKRIRKFSVTQDIGARAAIHIFNRISFAIAKGVRAQLVSRLPTKFF